MNPLRITLFAIAVAGLAGGFLAPHVDLCAYQSLIWGIAAGAVLSVLLFEIVTSLIKGEVGLDLVAGISISAALVFGETLAAGVVALMYAGGQLLEDYAANRARADMKALLARVPKTALRYSDGQFVRSIPIQSNSYIEGSVAVDPRGRIVLVVHDRRVVLLE